jgi:hypothetical protein
MALNLTQPTNLSQPSGSEPSIPKPSAKTSTKFTEKEESRFSVNEKVKLFFIILIGITIPTIITLSCARFFYNKELQQYKSDSNSQLIELRNQINLLTNPSVKQLEELENIVKLKITKHLKEKEELEKKFEYQELIKKTKDLDKQIIICNVHLKNIEIVKQNNYNGVDTLIENLKKEIIK